MKKILLSILLVLSFNICLACCYDDMPETDHTNNVHYQKLNDKDFYQVVIEGNDNKTNALQENKKTTKFIITDASTNGVDTTPAILEAKAFIVFYTVENDSLLYMSHVWPKRNSQSYGPIYSLASETKKEVYEEYKADVFNFDWLYITGYEDTKGTAKVQLIKVYEPQGITYVLKIIPPNLEIVCYKGYLEGSLNFSAFE